MTMQTRWPAYAAALLSAPFFLSGLLFAAPSASAQAASAAATAVPHPQWVMEARARTAREKPQPPAAPAKPQPPPRIPFTAAEDAAAVVPGMPEARFWADSEAAFKNALPPQQGPWLVLSSGGEDGAFGAGLIIGLTAAGTRPDYAVVTGVSTGALMAPFIFAGPHYDDALRNAYTKVSAADIFEAGSTAESFVDSWPLKGFIGNEITPALLADIAAEHRRGRRLFVPSYDLDAERAVVWNLGAIAAHGGDAALNLFRTVLLASSSVPGAFPPVLIEVEANGKRFQEMHVDGGIGGQFFVAPVSLMAPTSDYRLPATQLYVVVNTGLERDFQVVERFAPSILTQTVGAAVKVDTRLMIDRAYVVAKRSGVPFNVATIPPSFSAPSKGPFDPGYMGALFQIGYDLGKSGAPFSSEPPPYPAEPASPPSHIEKTGANQ
ncbi:MAG TPA: patatin-like phospholipase family protein [Xanthobacteraceae bacterium]|nr:patatin-like phospholipase family protein [Xanthobacteraceae bacterium]